MPLAKAAVLAGAAMLLFVLALWCENEGLPKRRRRLLKFIFITCSLIVIFGAFFSVEAWHPRGERIFNALGAGLMTTALASLWWVTHLTKTRHGNWVKGIFLGFVAAVFVASSAWLFTVNLRANRADHLSLFGWNTGFWVIWALIGGGFAFSAYRAFRRIGPGNAFITRRLGAYRWTDAFTAFIAIWAALCTAMLVFMAMDAYARGIPKDRQPVDLMLGSAIITLIGPGLLALVLIMRWRNRLSKSVTLEWPVLSPAPVDGMLHGTLHISQCAQDLTQLHLGLRLAQLDTNSGRCIPPPTLQTVPVLPQLNPQGIWQCEVPIALPIPKEWVPMPVDPDCPYPNHHLYVVANLPERRWTVFPVLFIQH